MHEAEAEGFLAVCIQHEVDQLDGLFWLQRLSKLKRDRLVKKWEKARGLIWRPHRNMPQAPLGRPSVMSA